MEMEEKREKTTQSERMSERAHKKPNREQRSQNAIDVMNGTLAQVQKALSKNNIYQQRLNIFSHLTGIENIFGSCAEMTHQQTIYIDTHTYI